MTPQRDPLAEELAQLPKIEASNGFAKAVLDRLDEPAAAPPMRATRWALAAAAAMLVMAVLVLRPPGTGEGKLSAEATELRRQHEELTRELEQLRSRTQDAAPVLYLGADDRIDYVLDLSPFLLPETGSNVPASHRGEPSTF